VLLTTIGTRTTTEVTVREQTKVFQPMIPPEKRASKKELQNFEIVERTPRPRLVLRKTRTASASPAHATERTAETIAGTVEKSPTVVEGNPVNEAEEIANETETEVTAATADVKANAKRAELTAVDTETEIVATELRTANGKLEPHETVEEINLTL